MSQRIQNAAVGLTTIVALLVLGGLIMLFGYVPAFIEGGYVIRLELADAAGLTEGSRVRLSGIDVGRVREVSLRDDGQPGVTASMLIRDDVRIPQAASVNISAPLLGGSPSVSIDAAGLSTQQMQQTLTTDGQAMVQGETRSLTRQMGQLAKRLEEAVPDVLDRVSELTDSFKALSATWKRVGQNVADMTEARSTAEVDAGDKPGNLASALARFDQRLAETQRVTEGLAKWVEDEQLRSDLQQTVANARDLTKNLNDSTTKLTDRLEGTITHADKLLIDTNQRVGQLTQKLAVASDELAATLVSARQTLDTARQGKGTVGKLLQDPALYNNLNDAAEKLGAVMSEVKMLLEKLQKEGVPLKL